LIDLSRLITVCSAPELPELPNYLGSFFLNNILRSDAPDETKSAMIVFLRRLASAVREYRQGREALVEFIALPQGSAPGITLYLKSLSHFEYTIVNSYLVLLAHNAIAATFSIGRAYSRSDRSPLGRLGKLYNSFKHSLLSEIAAPVWLTNEGLRGLYTEKGNLEAKADLSFTELVQILHDFEEEARFFSEDIYRIAAERRATAGRDTEQL
jgi:hypothetical protein